MQSRISVQENEPTAITTIDTQNKTATKRKKVLLLLTNRNNLKNFKQEISILESRVIFFFANYACLCFLHISLCLHSMNKCTTEYHAVNYFLSCVNYFITLKNTH